MSQYAIVIEGDGSANYSAYAPDLAGVAATGDTLEECEAAMREAIEFHIEGLRLAGLVQGGEFCGHDGGFGPADPLEDLSLLAQASRRV